MKNQSPAVLIACGLVFNVITLAAVGAPHDRPAPVPINIHSPPPPPPSVTGGTVTLVSTSVDLPDDTSAYPDGPHADVINANCTACHSASMALTQPRLSADQWRAEVTKMRATYKAPVADSAVPAIVAHLAAMPSQRAAPSDGNAARSETTGPSADSGTTG